MNAEEGGGELDPLILRMTGEAGTTPVAYVHLIGPGGTQIIPAILRPDLAVTQIAAQWAEALDLSAGSAAVVQLAKEDRPPWELWGPAEIVTPDVDDTLSDQIDDQGLGGLLLGTDFLIQLALTYIPRLGIVMVHAPEPEDEA